ncbi:MAG: LTA synthase family protein, partial [Chlamydiia bacterium]|nr:LTA synthase family protein [Chlamydiia bacterium]
MEKLRGLLWVFFGVETTTRIALLTLCIGGVALGPFSLLQTLLVGFLYDSIAFSYFLLPILFYTLVLPQRYAGGRFDRAFTSGLFAIYTMLLLFLSVGELLFWDELDSRFNFIAVDYLVYTHEVVGNVFESYPVVPIMGVLALLSAAVARFVWTRMEPLGLIPRSGRRLLKLAPVVCVLSFLFIDNGPAESQANAFNCELSKNGIYSLFSAFRQNDLSYKRFYKSVEDRAAIGTALRLMNEGQNATGIGIEHSVNGGSATQRYNVILVVVESLSAAYMQEFGCELGLTPHLDALIHDSLFFDQLYAVGTRTVYGLTAVTLGTPPVPGNAIARQSGCDHLFSLGAVLKDHGYSTKFIYGGFGYFDNMNAFFGQNGYDLVDRSDLDDAEITFANVWGVCDEDLFRKTIKEANKDFAEDRPFFYTVMTTSNHRPYTYPEGRIDIPSKTGRTGGVKYADFALRDLIDRAQAEPWFDNTILVITADHTASSAGKTDLTPEKYHIPLFIYAPKIIEPKRMSGLCSQIDIPPTILGMLHLSYDSRFFGQNLLEQSPQRAFIANYQKLGYLTPDRLTILKPVKDA